MGGHAGVGWLIWGKSWERGSWPVTLSPHRQLLSYITKDKQTESLVEKLCQRFRTARYAAIWGHLCAKRGLSEERVPGGTRGTKGD